METIIFCPVCNSTNYKTIYPNTLNGNLPCFNYDFSPNHMLTYEIIKCLTCSHEFCIIPFKNIGDHYQSIIDLDYINRKPSHILTAQKVIKIIIKYMPSGKLLDVGCATGEFLSVAQEYYITEGLEPSKWSSEIGKKSGFNIHTCSLNELPSTTKFDIITLWGVIEHFENLQAEIKKIYELLNPGGIVCLWTGNKNSWLARLLGKHWWYIQGQHVQFFNKQSLNKLFINNNFTNITIETYPLTVEFSALGKSLHRYKYLQKLSHIICNNKFMQHKTITLKLPGEMLAIYKKM